jgi:hypothetical protein
VHPKHQTGRWSNDSRGYEVTPNCCTPVCSARCACSFDIRFGRPCAALVTTVGPSVGRPSSFSTVCWWPTLQRFRRLLVRVQGALQKCPGGACFRSYRKPTSAASPAAAPMSGSPMRLDPPRVWQGWAAQPRNPKGYRKGIWCSAGAEENLDYVALFVSGEGGMRWEPAP